MAFAAYTRLRVLWGVVDYTTDPESPAYTSGNTANANDAGTAALRRCVFVWDRTALGADTIQTSLVLAQLSSGAVVEPSAGNLAAAETPLIAMWNSLKTAIPSSYVLRELRWYREGPGATPPEPVLRVTPVGTAGSASGSGNLPAQVRQVISLRTAYRKRWGRMYIPPAGTAQLTGDGRFSPAWCTTVATAYHTLAGALGALDWVPMVYSPTMSRGYAVERVWVDDGIEIQRSGRMKPSVHTSFPV